MDYTLTVDMEDALNSNEEAGLVVIQNDRYAIRLVITTKGENKEARLIRTLDGVDEVIGSEPLTGNAFGLKLEGENQSIKGTVLVDGKEIIIAENVDTYYLSTKVAGGFVGCTMGVYATSENEETGYADFSSLNLTKN